MNNLIKENASNVESFAAPDPSLRPTQDTYDAFQKAYDEANYVLFAGERAGCLITLQRRARTMGYFSPNRFVRADGEQSHELAVNPAYFRNCALIDTLSVFVHEMIHVWQEHFGKPGRGRYHNSEFAEMSESLGLMPSATGQPGGKRTGDRMSHYIIEGGKFERFARDLIERGFEIPWSETPPKLENAGIDGGAENKTKKGGKRPKYTCGICGQNAWAMHEAALVCGKDMGPMLPA